MDKWTRQHIWVVEWTGGAGWWEPTVGVHFVRDEGRRDLADWRKENPDDKFRLTKYVSTRKP